MIQSFKKPLPGAVQQATRSVAATLISLGYLVLAGPAAGQSGNVTFEQSQLSVITATARHRFQVEFAETPVQRARGLMWRRKMEPGRGMLFDFKQTGMVTMWMRNTYIPLDMLFITAEGTIVNIARNTVPGSETIIPSAGPVRAVLELNAGAAKRLGIRAGNRVEHAIFKPK